MPVVLTRRTQLISPLVLWLILSTGCSSTRTTRVGVADRFTSSSPSRATVAGKRPFPARSQQTADVDSTDDFAGEGIASSGEDTAGTTRLSATKPPRSVVDSASEPIRQMSGVTEQRLPVSLLESTVIAASVDGLAAESGLPSVRLQIPKELPGAEAPQIKLPPRDANDVEGHSQYQYIEKIFGDLPSVTQGRVKTHGQRRSYKLDELQAIALSANPLMSQADSQVIMLRGTALQAGLHPNPTIGYEGDTVGSGGTPNYQGGYINTTIKTAGKLKLAESVANVDVWNADLMRQKTRIDLITQVRGAYFAALIARENVKVTEALVRFTDSVYRIQVDLLKGGFASTYEPVQLRALANQARMSLSQAHNRYDAAWRQLAATVGVPDMQPGELEGTTDVPLPVIDYDALLPYVLSNHTDVVAARNMEVQARYNLRLQEVTRIPDLLFYTAVQKDFTTRPIYRTTYNMQVGVPVPVFDRNQGNILNAHGSLLKAAQEAARVQNDLATRLADAIERYENASSMVTMYRDHILPDQARAYRGVYERHQQQPDIVGFADVVSAQQTLLNSIGIYIGSLATRWQALTDVASLLQIETLEGLQAVMLTGSSMSPELTPDAPQLIPPSPAANQPR